MSLYENVAEEISSLIDRGRQTFTIEAFCRAPGRFRERVERLKFEQTIATPTLPQMAVTEFLENGGYDHHLRQMRRKLGFVLWVELPPGTSALALHESALAQGISIAPGVIFSAKQRFSNCIRLHCGSPWSDTIARATRTLGRLAGALPRGSGIREG